MAPARTSKRKWPYFAGQAGLLLPALGMLLGSALPWAYVLGRVLSASPTTLMWTFCAGLVTLAAAAAPWRSVVVFSAFAGGAVAVGFAVWQTVRIVSLCGVSSGCLPGPGLGLLLAGGIGALHRSVLLARAAVQPEPSARRRGPGTSNGPGARRRIRTS